jgi:hypothetical protein
MNRFLEEEREKIVGWETELPDGLVRHAKFEFLAEPCQTLHPRNDSWIRNLLYLFVHPMSRSLGSTSSLYGLNLPPLGFGS